MHYSASSMSAVQSLFMHPAILKCGMLPCLRVQLDECMRVCRPWALKYAEDEQLFFSDYVKAHLKLSELGSEWAPGAPYTLDI